MILEIVFDFDAKEEGGGAEVMNLEVLAEVCLDFVDFGFGRGSDGEVVDEDGNDDFGVVVAPDVDTRVRLEALESHTIQDFS